LALMMSLTCDHLSAIGSSCVVPSSTCTVNASTSHPFSANAAVAFSVELWIAGRTTADSATTSWHAVEPRYFTHSHAASALPVPDQIPSDRPLHTEARSPLGPIGVGATLVGTSSCPR